MKRRIVLAACLALVLVFVVRWQFPDDRGARLAPSLPDTRFDYTLTEFSARFRDAEGRVELLVSGPRLEHDSALRVATVIDPRFHIEPEDADWQGRADRALLLRDADEMQLEGNVVLTQQGERGEVRISSERLHHHGRTRTIEFPGPVLLQHPGSFVQAGRALLRLDDDIVEFSNHVQGELLPGRSGSGTVSGHDPGPGQR